MMIEIGCQNVKYEKWWTKGALNFDQNLSKKEKQVKTGFSEAYLSQIITMNYTGLLPQQI